MREIYYAGIGSRETPVRVLAEMRIISRFLSRANYILRSGGSDGADEAFFNGCSDFGGRCDIWVPWDGFNGVDKFRIDDYERIYNEVSKFHYHWNRCSDAVKRIHSRNYRIILGADDEPRSNFVVCWTPDGKDSGGTGFGMRIAREYHIPVYNLYHVEDRKKLRQMLSIIQEGLIGFEW